MSLILKFHKRLSPCFRDIYKTILIFRKLCFSLTLRFLQFGFLALFCIFVFFRLFILLFCASEHLYSYCININSSATLVFLTLWLFLDVKLPLVSSLSPQTHDNPLVKENKSFCYDIPHRHNEVTHHVTLVSVCNTPISLSLSLHAWQHIASVVVALVQKD